MIAIINFKTNKIINRIIIIRVNGLIILFLGKLFSFSNFLRFLFLFQKRMSLIISKILEIISVIYLNKKSATLILLAITIINHLVSIYEIPAFAGI